MTKRLGAVVGEYTKDNQQKAEWQNVGVLGVDKNGNEYVLLDAGVSIAGLLVKQNVLAAKRGEQPRDMVMTKVFDDNNQGQNNNQQQSQQQAGSFNQQGQHNQQMPQNTNNGGFQSQQQYNQQNNG